MNYLGGSHGSSASDFGSTNNSLATTTPGWTGKDRPAPRATLTPASPAPAEDLQNLDLETQKLLASVRGDDKPKKPPKKKESDPNARSSGYAFQPSAKKKRRAKRAASETPPRAPKADPPIVTRGDDLAKKPPSFMKQLNEARGTQTSNQNTARSDGGDEQVSKRAKKAAADAPAPSTRGGGRASSATTRSATPATPDPHATRAVAEANSLTFGAQEATIRDGSDSYVPQIGVRLAAHAPYFPRRRDLRGAAAERRRGDARARRGGRQALRRGRQRHGLGPGVRRRRAPQARAPELVVARRAASEDSVATPRRRNLGRR
jgi:hypothetical protein